VVEHSNRLLIQVHPGFERDLAGLDVVVLRLVTRMEDPELAGEKRCHLTGKLDDVAEMVVENGSVVV